MSTLLDLINQKKQAIQANNRGKTVKPPEGTSSWRILPRWDGDKENPVFWHDFGQHFIKDTKGNLKAVYVCADKTFGSPCPICDAIQHGVMMSPNDEVKNAIEQAKASQRVLINAVNISAEKPDVEILELAPGTFAALLSVITEWGTDSVLSLTGGRAITIERTGKGLQTKYAVQASSRTYDLPEAIMKKATNLDEYVKQQSVEQEKRALANLNQVAGLLGSSGAASAKPDLASVASDLDDLDGTNDIPDTLPAETVTQPAATVAAEPDSTSGGGDDNLDDLMKEIEGL